MTTTDPAMVRQRMLRAVDATVGYEGLPCPTMVSLHGRVLGLYFDSGTDLRLWADHLKVDPAEISQHTYEPADKPAQRVHVVVGEWNGWSVVMQSSEPADTRTCINPGDAEHDHETCRDVVAEQTPDISDVLITADGLDWRTECGLCNWTHRGFASRDRAEFFAGLHMRDVHGR